MEDKVTQVTEEQLREAVRVIQEAHPELDAIKASDYCCRSHAIDDIRKQYGIVKANLWQRLDTAKWLLGE